MYYILYYNNASQRNKCQKQIYSTLIILYYPLTRKSKISEPCSSNPYFSGVNCKYNTTLSLIDSFACFCVLAIINNARTMGVYFFKLVFSFPLDIFPEAKLLAHVIFIFSIFCGSSIYFLEVLPILLSKQCCTRVFFSHIYTSIYLLTF